MHHKKDPPSIITTTNMEIETGGDRNRGDRNRRR
jgi:hypothetical protein